MILENLWEIKTGIIQRDVSDHFPIFVISNLKISADQQSNKNVIFKRFVTDEAIRTMKSILQNTNWKFITNATSPDESYHKFIEYYKELYDIMFPIKRIKRKTKDILSPWITKGIKKSSRQKQKLYEKFLKDTLEDKLKKYKDYRKLFETIRKKIQILLLQ